MHPYLFDIFGFPIGTYGVLLAIGILIGLAIAAREAKRRGISVDAMADLNLILFVAALLGGRLTHVLVDFEYYQAHPARLVFSREGFVFFGGLLLGIAALVWFCRRRSIEPFRMADSYAVAIPLAHFFGRLGCFFAGCCFGGVCHVGPGVRFPAEVAKGDDMIHSIPFSHQLVEGQVAIGEAFTLPVYPVQLYEAAGNLLLFAFLFFWLRHRVRFDGQIILAYAIFYGILRFALEFLRADPRGHWLALSTSQWICIPVVAVAAALYWHRARHAPALAPGSPSGGADQAGQPDQAKQTDQPKPKQAAS